MPRRSAVEVELHKSRIRVSAMERRRRHYSGREAVGEPLVALRFGLTVRTLLRRLRIQFRKGEFWLGCSSDLLSFQGALCHELCPARTKLKAKKYGAMLLQHDHEIESVCTEQPEQDQ